MQKNFYYLMMTEDEAGAIALAPKEVDTTLWSEINKLKELPFNFVVVKGVMQDYLANNRGLLLFSEKLSRILAKFADQQVHWTSVNVMYESGGTLNYNALSFLGDHDVLHNERTLYNKVNGKVIKGVISLDKVQGLDLFVLPSCHRRFIVSEKVKQEIEQAGCTGVEFSKVPVA